MEIAPSQSMQTKPVSDICVNACQVGCGPLLTKVNASRGMAATRHSHVQRSNIGTSCARRSNRLPIAKVIGEISSTEKAPTLKS